MVSIVLFDLGDGVAAYGPTPRLARCAERCGRSFEEVRALPHGSGFSENCDSGVYSADT